MSNDCNEILEAKVAERIERAKKLYRYVTDVARRVGDMTAASRNINELFSTNNEVQRQKLRDNCEKLLFLDPTNYGKKSLELLWRKVYYETVSVAKKLRENDTNNDIFLFTHIICGIGHFHHLISKLQSEMNVKCNYLDHTALYNEEENQIVKNLTADEELVGRSAVHSCLIYLGDLSRYQTEIFNKLDPSVAARYYLQASHIDTSLGMPYNQLGNLYLDKNYNLDAVCYYIQCLSCVTPFEGAMDNLTKIFEKNTLCYDAIDYTVPLTPSEQIQYAIVSFLSLIEIWYLGKNDSDIPQRCNKIAHELKECMDFMKKVIPTLKNRKDQTEMIDEENNNPTYLNPNLLYKIVKICLFTIPKMSETDETSAFSCKAFTLALLSQLLQRLLKQLELMGLENPAHKYRFRTGSRDEQSSKNEEETNESSVEVPLDQSRSEETDTKNKDHPIEEKSEKMQNGDTKNNVKKSLAKRRRRRKWVSSDSSDLSDDDSDNSDIDTNESCSDEELSDSSYPSDNDESQSEDTYEASDVEDSAENSLKDVNDKIIKKLVNEDETINENYSEIEKPHNESNDKNIIDSLELQNFLLGDNILSSIKLLQDWVLTEKDLVLSCGDSGESLFQCVVDLLNILTFYFSPSSDEVPDEVDCQILKYAKKISKKMEFDYKTIPLPEDISLRGTNICKFDKDATEWQVLEKYNLSVYDENVIRILHFLDFGNQIAKIVPRIRFNRTMKIFYLKKTPSPKLTTKPGHKKTREWHNSKKQVETTEGGLLRRLGRLWLASQVRELERSGQSTTPALLALDTAVLNKHLRRIKHLLRTRNFVFLVPTVVLEELDNLKREQSTARDAIRWLELQLKSGTKFLRAQRPGQSRSLSLLKYSRKAPGHIQNFIKILEFCNHYIGDEKQVQGGCGDTDNSLQGKTAPLLILLVGNEKGIDDEQYKEYSLCSAVQAAGISVQFIGDFYAKWRQTVHKSGKKR